MGKVVALRFYIVRQHVQSWGCKYRIGCRPHTVGTRKCKYTRPRSGKGTAWLGKGKTWLAFKGTSSELLARPIVYPERLGANTGETKVMVKPSGRCRTQAHAYQSRTPGDIKVITLRQRGNCFCSCHSTADCTGSSLPLVRGFLLSNETINRPSMRYRLPRLNHPVCCTLSRSTNEEDYRRVRRLFGD